MHELSFSHKLFHSILFIISGLWDCCVIEKAATCNSGTPYGYQFEICLLHFPPSFLLRHLRKMGRMFKCLGSCIHVEDPEAALGSWQQPLGSEPVNGSSLCLSHFLTFKSKNQQIFKTVILA